MNAIKLLSEAMSVYDLSPEQAAGYVGCSGSQIRRWLAGRFEPTAVYVQAIVRGVEKMKAELSEPSAAWRSARAPEDDPGTAAEKKFLAQMKDVFERLEPQLTADEKYLLFVAHPDSWQGFTEVLSLVRKYGVKLPK